MGLQGDERGQAIQIGFVLIVGTLVVSFALYQAFVVPNQNREVEFNHNQEVTAQLQDLRNALVSSVSRSATVAVAVSLGTTYPSRVAALNPPPSSGTLRTIGTRDAGVNLSVNNAVAQDVETGDYWNGSQRNVSTGLVEYRPDYNEYRDAPRTVYDNTVLYNQFDGANLTVTGQAIVDGNRITLVVLNGSVQAARSGSYSVDVTPISTSTGATLVENETGENLTVSFPSRLPEGKWEDVLSGERDDSGPDDRHVTAVDGTRRSDGLSEITLTFESGTYQLRMAKVGVGSGATAEEAAYLTDVRGDGRTLQQGETIDLVVAVRDRFNNPVPDVTVNATVADGTVESEATTGDDGAVSFEYTAPSGASGEVAVNFSYASTPGASFDSRQPEGAQMNVTVQRGGGGGGGGGSAYSTVWEDPSSGQSGVSCPNWPDTPCTLDASVTTEIDLTVDTDPTAGGADVFYSQNDSTKGLFSVREGVTASNGEHTTRFEATENGTIKLYTSSGGSGDTFDLQIENLPPESGLLVFRGYDGNDKQLASVELSTGTVRSYGNTKQPRALGPSADIDNQGGVEIPYVSNNQNEIKIVDAGTAGDQPETLYEKSGSEPKPAADTRLGVGDLDQDGDNAVFFTGDSGSLWKYENGDEGLTEIPGIGTSVDAVVGVADISGSNGPDLVFVGSGKIKYYNPTTGTVTDTGTSINTPKAAGEPADFADGDDDVEVPYHSGNSPSYLRLADKDGEDEQITTSEQPLEQPLGTAQVTPAGSGDEIIFLNQSNFIKYTTVDGTTGFVLDSSGDMIEVEKKKYGVVAGREP
jgi:hypothetical protein